MVHQIVKEHCDLIHVVRHGESSLSTKLPRSAPGSSKIGLINQQGHRLRHRPTVTFLDQPTCLLIHHHIWNPTVAGGHHRQTAKLSFHHGDRASLLITILRRAGMLHRHPRTTHLLGHRIG